MRAVLCLGVEHTMRLLRIMERIVPTRSMEQIILFRQRLAVRPPQLLFILRIVVRPQLRLQLIRIRRPGILILLHDSSLPMPLTRAIRQDPGLAVLQQRHHTDRRRRTEKKEDEDAEAHARLRGGAFGCAAVFEFGIAVAAAVLPDRDGCEGGEPEDGEERVEGGVGVDVGEAPGACPEGHEDLVAECWEGEEALQARLSNETGGVKGGEYLQERNKSSHYRLSFHLS